jgi:hypothetical protein
MTERVCENCRWFRKDDLCWRYPKENATLPDATCGEWADAGMTPEDEERQELIRRFAVAIIGTEWGGDLAPIAVWGAARGLALMESAVLPTAETQIQKENEQ